MPSIGRVGIDTAGGVVINGCNSVTVNDLPVVRLNSQIQDHGQNEHNAARMVSGFNDVTVEDLPVCGAGSRASCGHPLISSSNVEVG